MENSFVMPHESSYDVVIVIPTLNKAPNQKRVAKIVDIITKNPPKGLSYNIYLAYEGRDWNDAVNKALDQVSPKITKGFILLDDDSFPLPNWADNLDYYMQKYPSSILQFCLLDRKGFYHQYFYSQIDDFSRVINRYISKLTPRADAEKLNSPTLTFTSHYYTKIKKPIKSAFACFSGVFISKKIFDTVGNVVVSNEIIYSEDVDFCFRALTKGYNSLIIPQYVLHFCCSTKSQKSVEYKNKLLTTNAWLHEKWFSTDNFFCLLKEQGLTKTFAFRFLWILVAKFLKHRAKNIQFAQTFTERLELAV